MRRRTVSTIDVDGIEIELDMDPEWLDEFEIVKPTPETLVVGYLMHDESPINPMKNCDGEGTLYTYGERVITDSNSAPAYLGLNSFQSRGRWRSSDFELDRDLDLDGIEERVAEKVCAKIKEEPELSAWMVQKAMEFERGFDDVVLDLVQLIAHGDYYARCDWSGADEEMIANHRLVYETLASEAWDELYAEGKIGDYLAVPVYYCASAHGPGTTRIYTTSIDDCNAVWVPDESAISNMNFSECKTYADKLAVADKYASSILSEYEEWCNGECYGVVVETFVKEGDEYVKVGDTDSCWSYIGQEWAEEALKDEVRSTAEQIKKEQEERAQYTVGTTHASFSNSSPSYQQIPKN